MTSCSLCKSLSRKSLRSSLIVVRKIVRSWDGIQKHCYNTSQFQQKEKSKKVISSTLKVPKKPAHYWVIPSNRTDAMKELGNILGFKEYEDWYKIKAKDFLDNNMHGLLKAYNGSAAQVVMNIFKDHEWHPWRFEPTPKGFWDKDHALLDFMKYLGEKMRFKTYEDWYKLKSDDIIRYGGSNILQHKYGGSASAMVEDSWKEHQWNKWMFSQVPKAVYSTENHVLFLEYVKQRLNFTSLEDWYKIRETDIVDLGGKFLLTKYHSAPNLVMEVFKNHTWDAFRFSSSVSKPKPVTFEDQRALLLKIGNILGYTKPADYYNLSQPLLQANGGYYLLEEYKKGVREIVTALFPEHAWEPWKFNSSNWWESGELREKYMQYLYEKLEYKKIEDWYKVTLGDFRANHGSSLVQKYNGKASDVVMAILHSHAWEPWLFSQLPPDFWDDREMLLRFVHHLGDKLGYKTIEDWYQVTSRDFVENGGKDLLQKYKAPCEVVMCTFQEHEWHPWKFPVVPKKFWMNQENKRKYLEYLGKKLGFTKMEHWYAIRQRDFAENYGLRLLTIYNGSPSAIVMNVMSNHEWVPWRFTKAHFFSSALQSPASLRSYFSYVGKQLQIQELSDWYRVALPQLEEFGPTTYFRKVGLAGALAQAYPNYKWEAERFQLAWQRWLKTILQKHLPGIEVIENFVSSLQFEESGVSMTADVFIPSLNIALEYNGKPHYTNTSPPGNPTSFSHETDSFFGNVVLQKKFDVAKTEKFAENGITLIQVPHWWDGKIGSLVEVIHKSRPDIQFKY